MVAYPVRGLDINSSYTIYNLLNKQKESGVAVIFVGEDLDVLIELCDRIMVMNSGLLSIILSIISILPTRPIPSLSSGTKESATPSLRISLGKRNDPKNLKEVLTVKNLSVKGAEDKLILDDVNFFHKLSYQGQSQNRIFPLFP